MKRGCEAVSSKERVGLGLLCMGIRNVNSWPVHERTLAVYEHVGALPVCAQEYSILVKLCLGQAWEVVHRLQELCLLSRASTWDMCCSEGVRAYIPCL